MDIQQLDIADGDVIFLTYNDELDVDVINTHYERCRLAIQAKYDCIVIANRTDFIEDITVLKGDGEVLPFR